MKSVVVLIAAMAIASSATARDIRESSPVVNVCVHAYPNPFLMHRAQYEASVILAELPVEIHWNTDGACRASDAIHIYAEYSTPPPLKPGALAYALPYKGTYIDLFYDRIVNMTDSRNLHNLLAHVLAHEITHILERRVRHSEIGVMKAQWSRADLEQMKRTRLHFAPEDIEMVRAKWLPRAGAPCATSRRMIRRLGGERHFFQPAPPDSLWGSIHSDPLANHLSGQVIRLVPLWVVDIDHHCSAVFRAAR